MLSHYIILCKFSCYQILKRITRRDKNMTLNYEHVVGKRINSKLLYVTEEKQLYSKKTIKKEKYFYACYVKTCKARVFLESEVCYKVKDFIDHNHETQEDTYRELKIMNNMKTSCMEIHQDSTEPSVLGSIRKIFQSTCVE